MDFPVSYVTASPGSKNDHSAYTRNPPCLCEPRKGQDTSASALRIACVQHRVLTGGGYGDDGAVLAFSRGAGDLQSESVQCP